MNASNKVLSAIDAVMAEIGSEGISKGRKNQQQNYAFRGIDDVYNALAPILAKHHLIIIPCVQSRELLERSTKGGGALFYVTVQVKWTLASSEDGSSVEAVTYGEAMDTADKATNKAMSAAYKYMAMMTFCIPTEGDNDADSTTHQVASAADMAINLLRGCGDAALFKEAFEKNKDGWKEVLSEADAKRVWAVKDEMVAKFKTEAEAKNPPKPNGTSRIDDDPIPF